MNDKLLDRLVGIAIIVSVLWGIGSFILAILVLGGIVAWSWWLLIPLFPMWATLLIILGDAVRKFWIESA